MIRADDRADRHGIMVRSFEGRMGSRGRTR